MENWLFLTEKEILKEIGKSLKNQFPRIGKNRNDQRQPGLLVRVLYARHRLRRVGGI